MKGRGRLFSLLGFLVLTPAFLFAPPASAAKFYVSVKGSDSNPGTFGAPFQTIQKAASLMAAGDTCFIRAGTYRETVTPANSGTATAPIVFKPYQSDRVVVSGADPITGWTHANGHIYQAAMRWTLGAGNNQVFVDGKMVNEARWPATGPDLLRPTLAVAGAGTTASEIDDPNLTQPAGYWDGATVWVLGGSHPWEPWIAETATVSSSSAGKIQFGKFTAAGSDYDACPGSLYYLAGGPLSSLDSPGEWWLGNGTLSLWLPNSANPAGHAIEAKRRDLAFDLTAKAYVRIEGLNVFAATISMANASYCVVDDCDLKYLSHFVDCAGAWDTRDDTGVIMSGSHNTVSGCVIEYSAGNGVAVLGSDNEVIDCLVRDADYAGIDSAGIRVTGIHQSVLYNTVFETGRTAILNRELKASRILHNDISYYCMLTKDAGGTYCWQTDGQGTVIAYNKFHDTQDSLYPGHPFVPGPYLDNGTSNTIVHHNVVWNVAEGIRMNPPCNNDLVISNTFENTSVGESVAGSGDYSGSVIADNIFAQPIDKSTGGSLIDNLPSSTDPEFVNAARGDFELRPGSPAIDSGKAYPPYTDGYMGAAPDIGAYEHGKGVWSAGASFAPGQPFVEDELIDGRVVLVWKPVVNATYYRVWRRAGTSGAYTLVADHVTAPQHAIEERSAGQVSLFAVSAASARAEGPLSAPLTTSRNP